MQDGNAEEKKIDIEENPTPTDEAPKAEDSAIESAEEITAAKLAEAEEKYLRLYADFDNYRRRAAKERLEVYGAATGELLEKLLPVLDNFSRAMNAKAGEESFQSGIKMVYRQLSDILKEAGLEPIEALGNEFDPQLHFAVVTENDENTDDNIITKELQTGYIFKGKVLRAAMVAVNQK